MAEYVKYKKALISIIWMYLLISAYVCSYFYSESLCHIFPSVEKRDLSYLSEKTSAELSANDYDVIFSQTGLGRAAAESLPSLSELSEYQRVYFGSVECERVRNSPISYEERVVSPEARFADIQDGDIIVTRSSRILSWRNGHAAVVTDAENGITLEAAVIGENSSFRSVSKWAGYPNFTVLRLKGASAGLRSEIARRAAETLADKPYNAAAGVFTRKYLPPEETRGTQCAHLVWTAYAAYGFDIDADKGLIVTPEDIAGSPLLETVQKYG